MSRKLIHGDPAQRLDGNHMVGPTLARPSTSDLADDGTHDGTAPNSAHERMLELTALLASGIHRLRSNRSALPECTSHPKESAMVSLIPLPNLALIKLGLHDESEELDDGH